MTDLPLKIAFMVIWNIIIYIDNALLILIDLIASTRSPSPVIKINSDSRTFNLTSEVTG